jgi:hypothetical protein
MKRLARNKRSYICWEQLFRGVSSERRNRMAYHQKMRRWMDDRSFRAFFEGETRDVPAVLVNQIRQHLGPLWKWLPEEALKHDPNAYLHSGVMQQLPVIPSPAAATAAV